MNDLREYLEDLVKHWFTTEDINKATASGAPGPEYCDKNLPKFDNAQYHKIDDIDAKDRNSSKNMTSFMTLTKK